MAEVRTALADSASEHIRSTKGSVTQLFEHILHIGVLDLQHLLLLMPLLLEVLL